MRARGFQCPGREARYRQVDGATAQLDFALAADEKASARSAMARGEDIAWRMRPGSGGPLHDPVRDSTGRSGRCGRP